MVAYTRVKLEYYLYPTIPSFNAGYIFNTYIKHSGIVIAHYFSVIIIGSPDEVCKNDLC